MLRMPGGKIATRYTVVQLMIAVVRMLTGTEGTAVVMVMIRIAVMPVTVIRPAVMNIPPSRIIAPVPR